MSNTATKEFALGDRVEWTSSASGTTRTKHGTIAEIVPPDHKPSLKWTRLHSSSGVGMPRDHISYVVVADETAYWPRVKALALEAPETVNAEG